MILRLKTRESRSLPGLPIASSSLPFFKNPRPQPRRGFLHVWASSSQARPGCRRRQPSRAIGGFASLFSASFQLFSLFLPDQWALRSTRMPQVSRFVHAIYPSSQIPRKSSHGLPIRFLLSACGRPRLAAAFVPDGWPAPRRVPKPRSRAWRDVRFVPSRRRLRVKPGVTRTGGPASPG